MQSCGLAFISAFLSGLCRAAWLRRTSHLSEHQQCGKLLWWAYLNANERGKAKHEEKRQGLLGSFTWQHSHLLTTFTWRTWRINPKTQWSWMWVTTPEDLNGCSGTPRLDRRDASPSGSWSRVGQQAALGTPSRNQLCLQAPPDVIWRKHDSLYQTQPLIKLKRCLSSDAASGRDQRHGWDHPASCLGSRYGQWGETGISQGPFTSSWDIQNIWRSRSLLCNCTESPSDQPGQEPYLLEGSAQAWRVSAWEPCQGSSASQLTFTTNQSLKSF